MVRFETTISKPKVYIHYGKSEKSYYISSRRYLEGYHYIPAVEGSLRTPWLEGKYKNRAIYKNLLWGKYEPLVFQDDLRIIDYYEPPKEAISNKRMPQLSGVIRDSEFKLTPSKRHLILTKEGILKGGTIKIKEEDSLARELNNLVDEVLNSKEGLRKLSTALHRVILSSGSKSLRSDYPIMNTIVNNCDRKGRIYIVSPQIEVSSRGELIKIPEKYKTSLLLEASKTVDSDIEREYSLLFKYLRLSLSVEGS